MPWRPQSVALVALARPEIPAWPFLRAVSGGREHTYDMCVSPAGLHCIYYVLRDSTFCAAAARETLFSLALPARSPLAPRQESPVYFLSHTFFDVRVCVTVTHRGLGATVTHRGLGVTVTHSEGNSRACVGVNGCTEVVLRFNEMCFLLSCPLKCAPSCRT